MPTPTTDATVPPAAGDMHESISASTCTDGKGTTNSEASGPNSPTAHSRNREKAACGDAAAGTSPRNDARQPTDSHDSAGKPQFFSLCTKCANDGKDKSQHDRREPVRGLIIRSESFMNASEASRWEVEAHCNSCPCGDASCASSSPSGEGFAVSPPDRPVFDRSKIVHEVLLEGGQQISDIYDTVNGTSLGKGSYGSVVKAKDIKTGIMRAIKVVYKPRIENVTRLKREILIMKRLDHPNIIKLLEVYEDMKNLYLVMELCTGGELFERIIKSGHFSERYAASLMKQVFSAASYCHSQNVIHRDLKPENLLYADSSPLSALKVIGKEEATSLGAVTRELSCRNTNYPVPDQHGRCPAFLLFFVTIFTLVFELLDLFSRIPVIETLFSPRRSLDMMADRDAARGPISGLLDEIHQAARQQLMAVLCG